MRRVSEKQPDNVTGTNATGDDSERGTRAQKPKRTSRTASTKATAKPVSKPASKPATKRNTTTKPATKPQKNTTTNKRSETRPDTTRSDTTRSDTTGSSTANAGPSRSRTARTNSRQSDTAKSGNSSQQRSANRRSQTAPHLAPVQPSSAPRKVTMGNRTRAISLRTDLQKFGREEYVQEDFITGTQLIIDAGAGDRLRDLVASVLRSKGAFGNMQSENVMEGLLDLLSKGYTKRRVAERKSIRAMLNWCSGLAQTDPAVEGELLRVVLSHGNSGE